MRVDDEVAMDTNELLREAFERTRDDVRSVTTGLDAAGLTFRPDPDANSIAWLVWHATRVQDDHLAALADREQRWTASGWVERFGFGLPPADTGYGHDSGQVDLVRPEGTELLVDYHTEVHDETVRYLATIDAAALERIVDERYDPPVTVGVRLVSVLHDGMQHLGQAAYVRGLLERRPG